ncbi:YciI family protein [Flexibacterium corallicola]|uniref:YciI family protein n=1 Tax=Flexibacterium corallicola TaxID=3037259 RepID=UPI00286F602E|nr:YciI family protein [Pseudovibrio sp. M1P-2-3]
MPLFPASQAIFVVDLHYRVPLEQVDPFIEAHIAFLKNNYAKGLFIMSGPKVPRTGGVIIAQCESKATLEACLQEDPFYLNGVADYTVNEFKPSAWGPQLAKQS